MQETEIDNKFTKIYKYSYVNEIPSNYVYITEDGKEESILSIINENIDLSIEKNYEKVKGKMSKMNIHEFINLWINVKSQKIGKVKSVLKKYLNDINNLIINNSNKKSVTYDDYKKLESLYNTFFNETYLNYLERDKIVIEEIKNTESTLLDEESLKCSNIEITDLIIVFNMLNKNKTKLKLSDGIEIFNDSICTIDIPMIRYTDSENKTIYKVLSQQDVPHDLFIKSTLITPVNDTLFILLCIGFENSKREYEFCTINLKTQKIKVPLKFQKENIEDIEKRIYNSFGTIILEKDDENKIKGHFLMEKLEVHENILHYLIITNPVFNRFLFVEEMNKAYAEKKKYNIHYKTFTGLKIDENSTENISAVTISFENKIEEQDFALQKDEIPPIKVNFIKAESKSVLNEFIVIFSKLMSLYMSNINKIQKKFDKIIYEGSETSSPKFKEITKLKKTSKKQIFNTENKDVEYHKIKNLQVKSPTTFDIGKKDDSYVKKCSCKFQPIIIKDEEIEDWKNNTFVKEGNQLSKREVLKFMVKDYKNNPGEGEGGDSKGYINIVCPTDKYPYPKVNKYKKSDGTYGYFPSCKLKDSSKTNDQNDDENEAEEDIVKVKNYNYKVGSYKLIKKSGTNGKLHKTLVDLLRSNMEQEFYNNDFIRVGIQMSKNSLIHCVLLALNKKSYVNLKSEEEREKYVQKVRNEISGEINPSVYKQELYDLTDEEIILKIKNENIDFDPYLFYRGLEEYFNINIFVFNSIKTHDKDNSETLPNIELPRSKFSHIRVPYKRDSVIILKHISFKEDNTIKYIHCELVISKGKIVNNLEEIQDANDDNFGNIKVTTKTNNNFSKEITLFNKKMGENLLNVFNDSLGSYIFNYSDENKINCRKNPLSIVNWDKHMKKNNLEIISQKIDQYGKTTAFLVQNEKNIKFTIIVPPTQPLNLPLFEKYEYSEMKHIKKNFGKYSQISKYGLWYEFLDIKNGIFILCKNTGCSKSYCDNLIKSELFIDGPFIDKLLHDTPTENGNLTCGVHEEKGNYCILKNINIMRNSKKNVNILMQIVNWLWKLTIKENGVLQDFGKWSEAYLHIKKENNYYEPTEIKKNFPEAENTKEGLSKIKKWWPEYFKKDGIYFYEKLYNNVKGFFKREYQIIEGLKNNNFYNKIPEVLEDIYLYEEDFKQKKENIIFMDETFMKKWINLQKYDINLYSENTSANILKKISIDFYNMSEPYIYKDQTNGKIYLIQNVKSGNLSRALNLCKIWKKDLFNYGIETPEDPDEDFTPYVVYGISKNNELVPIKNETNDEKEFFQVLKYTTDSNKYASILPIL